MREALPFVHYIATRLRRTLVGVDDYAAAAQRLRIGFVNLLGRTRHVVIHDVAVRVRDLDAKSVNRATARTLPVSGREHERVPGKPIH